MTTTTQDRHETDRLSTHPTRQDEIQRLMGVLSQECLRAITAIQSMKATAEMIASLSATDPAVRSRHLTAEQMDKEVVAIEPSK
jgi:hypothetical protein